MKSFSSKRVALSAAVALAVSAGFLAQAMSAEGLYYFRKGPGLIPMHSGQDDGPGDGQEQPNEGPLAISLDLPDAVVAETGLTAGLTRSSPRQG